MVRQIVRGGRAVRRLAAGQKCFVAMAIANPWSLPETSCNPAGTHRGHNKVFLDAPRMPSSASAFVIVTFSHPAFTAVTRVSTLTSASGNSPLHLLEIVFSAEGHSGAQTLNPRSLNSPAAPDSPTSPSSIHFLWVLPLSCRDRTGAALEFPFVLIHLSSSDSRKRQCRRVPSLNEYAGT